MRIRRLVSRWTPMVVCLGMGLAACSTTPSRDTPRNRAIAGVYTLVSIDGVPIPGTIRHQGMMVEVQSGVFTLWSDGTCRTRTVFHPPPAPEPMVREVDATYTWEGETLIMKWEGAGFTTARFQGDVLLMDNEGLVYVYRR